MLLQVVEGTREENASSKTVRNAENNSTNLEVRQIGPVNATDKAQSSTYSDIAIESLVQIKTGAPMALKHIATRRLK